MIEFSTRVQHSEDDLERALLACRVLIYRNAAAIVFYRDRRAILVKGHPDIRGVPVHGLVDGIVENLPDEVMQTGAADAADVHAGTPTDRLETFEYGDVFCGVGH